ncbi:MAG: hypothetical protein M3451_01510 [Chloroflexota bacterium]|nr:hypothetical protein [Chloroflexota bacterium]
MRQTEAERRRLTGNPLLGLFVLVALGGASCSQAPREASASAEQIAYLQEGLNPGFTIGRAYAIRDERGMEAYDIRAEVYGPGVEQGVALTWRVAGPKHAPQYGLITSRIPVEAFGAIRFQPRGARSVKFQPSEP